MNKHYQDLNGVLKALLLGGLFLFLPLLSGAQCDGAGLVSGDCSSVPISTGCQLDGFCYGTNSTANTNGPPLTECGGTTMFGFDNVIYLAFSATGPTAEINVLISSCSTGEGLQTAILEDCNSSTTLSTCNSYGDDRDHNILASGLTVGQTYYLLIDGFNGDECDFTLEVISGIDYGLASAEVDITSGASGAIDCDNPTVVVSANSTAANTSYQWTTFDGVIESGDQTPTATVSEAGDYTVIVTDDDTGCVEEVTVSVVDNGVDPDQPNNPGPATTCAGSTNQIYSITPAANATSYSWNVPAGATIVGADDGTSITVNWVTTATNGQICVAGVNGCGAGNQTCFSVTVNPVPATPSITTSTNNVCASATGVAFGINPVTGASNYTWTTTVGAAITTATDGETISVAFAANATSVDICVTANNTCGSSLSDCVTVTVDALPTAPGVMTGIIDVCTGATNIAYMIPAVTGATDYDWVLPTGATISSGMGTNAVSLDFSNTAMSGDVCVTPTNNCGSSSQTCFPVSILTTPAQPNPISTLSTNLCQGNTGLIYSIPAVAGATSYEWDVPTGATIRSGQGSTLITVDYGNTAVSGNICVTAINNCNARSVQRCIPIDVESAPAQPSITGAANACRGETGVVYTIASIANATQYNWTIPTGFSLSLNADQTIATVDFAANAGTGDICVRAQNRCAVSTEECFTVTLTSGPSVPMISGTSTVCVGTNQTYTASATGVTNYNWMAPTGVQIMSGQNTPSINTQITTSAVNGNICVEVTSSCGRESNCFPITIDQLLPPPAMITGGDQHCAGTNNTNYNITPIPGATSYQWTIPANASITSDRTQANVSIDWGSMAIGGQICVSAINDCGVSLPTCKPVVINPIPTADFTVETPICTDNSATITYTGTASATANYTWNFNGGVATPANGRGPFEVQWPSEGTKTIVLTVEENGCTSSTIQQTLRVDAPLAAPDIDCTPTTNSISFSWDDVGASSYQVNVLSGPTGTRSGNNYNVTGLTPGDELPSK